MLLIVSDSQAIRRFNINSNKYLKRTDRKSRHVITCVTTALDIDRIIRLETQNEKLKNHNISVYLTARVIT